VGVIVVGVVVGVFVGVVVGVIVLCGGQRVQM